LRRLEELNRQIAGAAKSIGNHELQAKCEKRSDLLKHDILFCCSLHLKNNIAVQENEKDPDCYN